tara:strand:- start:2492 stop:3073 length:582 start_codon:yes stop_codon:yes gene_type:complete
MEWNKYLENTKNAPPRPLLRESLQYVNQDSKRRALDLGAGSLNDTRFLIEQDFHVVIVDSNPTVEDLVRDLPKNTYEVEIKTFDKYRFPKETFSLVNAQYALPFSSPSTFKKVISDMKNSIEHKGIFTGQFFGIKDDWADNKEMTFTTLEGVKEVFGKDWEIHKLEEEKVMKKTAAGKDKFWHVFHVIAEKVG